MAGWEVSWFLQGPAVPAPDAYLDALVDAGFDRLNVANSHALARAGANAVIGNHSRTLGPAEILPRGDVTSSAYVRYFLGNFQHAGKSYTARLGGIDRVCFQRTDDGWTLGKVEFIPTIVRRDSGLEHPDAYQPVPLVQAVEQCRTKKGPFPYLRSWECADLRWFKERLQHHPTLTIHKD